jgi:hypothetical protein
MKTMVVIRMILVPLALLAVVHRKDGRSLTLASTKTFDPPHRGSR